MELKEIINSEIKSINMTKIDKQTLKIKAANPDELIVKEKRIGFRLPLDTHGIEGMPDKYYTIKDDLRKLGGENNEGWITFSEDEPFGIMFSKEIGHNEWDCLAIPNSSTFYAEAKEFIEIIKKAFKEAEQQEEEMNGQTIN
jgi:hypothetical protein